MTCRHDWRWTKDATGKLFLKCVEGDFLRGHCGKRLNQTETLKYIRKLQKNILKLNASEASRALKDKHIKELMSENTDLKAMIGAYKAVTAWRPPEKREWE